MEKDKPGEQKKHRLSFLFKNTSVFIAQKLVSPGHIHDEILLLLHLKVVDDGGESRDNPLPQVENWTVLPEGRTSVYL